MSERVNRIIGYIWGAPVIGPVVQIAVLLLPMGLIGVSGIGARMNDSPGGLLGVAILQIIWLWALERYGRQRLVTPFIPIRWLWLFVAFALYNLLAMFGLVEPF